METRNYLVIVNQFLRETSNVRVASYLFRFTQAHLIWWVLEVACEGGEVAV